MGKLYLGTQEVTPAIYDKAESAGATREVDANGKYGYPAQNFFSLPSNATDMGDYALYYTFQYRANLISVDLSSLTTVSGKYALGNAFYQCHNLTSVDLSSLTTVSGDHALGSAFSNCHNLTSVNLSSLTTVSGNEALIRTFISCDSLVSVDFSSLTAVGYGALKYAFQSCESLTSLSFPALTASSFSYYTSQFDNMLNDCTGVTVHFPAVIKTTIENWSSVTNGFGGTNTTVLFDL